MTTAAELLAAGPAKPPFDIVRAAYAELHVTDLDVSEHFYAELLGMVVSARTDDAVYLRGWEERQHHSIVLRRAKQLRGGAHRLPGALGGRSRADRGRLPWARLR